MPKRIESAEDAKEILRHGTIHGKPLTEKQKGLFGAIAGGSKSALRKVKTKRKAKRKLKKKRRS